MHQYLTKSSVIFFTAVIFISICTFANAYVMQGLHILELMVQKLGKPKGLLVSQKLVLYDDNQQKIDVELNETLRYIFPETFRSDTLSENVQRIHVLSKGETLTVIDGKTADDPKNSFDRYKDILLFRSRSMLQSRLPFLGVDISVSSLGRFKGKISYVIGAQYPDETVPQIWLDKITFKPLRWIMINKESESNGNSLEIRYLEWREMDSAWYPMRIQYYRNEHLIREILVQNIIMNLSFSDELFDIEYLRSIYPSVTPVVTDQDEVEKEDEIQKIIEEFKNIYER